MSVNSIKSSEVTKPTLAILQLARIGDIIQTVQAVEHVRALHPQYRVILIARSQFSSSLQFLLKKHFDEVYSLDTQHIFLDHQISGLSSTMYKLDAFLGTLKTETIDVLVNLTFSKTSAYLASVIPSKFKVGPYFDLNNTMQVSDKWSQLLYSSVMRGPLNPFSLVDLFRNIIGSKAQPTLLNKVDSSHRENYILVHPFASSERKSWKAEKWVEVIYKTLKDNPETTVTIAGAKNEILKSQLITENALLKKFSNRVLNLTGKTTLEELSLIASKAKLFVGHDSMVGHLASLSKTQTLTISLGNVRPHETTPYLEGAYNLSPRTKCAPCFPDQKCEYNQCHHDISYQLVSNVINQLLSGEDINETWLNKTNSSFHLSSVNLYRTKFINEHLTLESPLTTHLDTADIFRNIYMVNWSFNLAESELVLPFPKLGSGSLAQLQNALIGVQNLYELADFGKRYSQYILEEISSKTPNITKIKEFSAKIDEIDQLQKMVLKTSGYLAPVVDYFTVRKGNLHGDNIVKLTESSYYCYEEFSNVTSALYELLSMTINENSPQGKSRLATPTK